MPRDSPGRSRRAPGTTSTTWLGLDDVPAQHDREAWPRMPTNPGADSRQVLTDWGFGKAEIEALIAEGTVAEDAERSAAVYGTAPT